MINGHGAQLADLVPITRSVRIGDAEFILYPINITQLAQLISRHPALVEALNVNPSMASLAFHLPEVVPAIICASLHQPEAEAAAEGMPLELQIEFLDKIAEISIPSGVRPLMEMLARIVTGRVGMGQAGQPRASRN